MHVRFSAKHSPVHSLIFSYEFVVNANRDKMKLFFFVVLVLAAFAIDQSSACRCEYRGRQGGCAITEAAPANLACKCAKHGLVISSCKGKVVSCKDGESRQCIKPDTSIYSCIQGGGNCKGY